MNRHRHGAAALLALAFCVLFGCTREKPAEPPPPVEAKAPPPPPPANDWPTFHGDAGLTGYSPVALPDAPALRWRVKAEAPVRYTPVAANGRVYFSNIKGKLFCVDLDGTVLWSKNVFDPDEKNMPTERVKAPLLLTDNAVVVTSGQGGVYAFNVADGQERWRYSVDGSIRCSPNAGVRAGRPVLYFMESAEGLLYCLDMTTGQLVWKTPEGVGRCESALSYGNDCVVFGSCASKLHVFAAEDGKLLRNIDTGPETEVAGGVALDGVMAYSGSRSGQTVQADTKTGEITWKNTDPQDEVFTTPALTKDVALFACKDGFVYAVERKTGKAMWKFDTKSDPYSPVVACDKVAFAAEGELFLLRLTSGEKVWSYKLSDDCTSPALVNQMMVTGSEDGSVAAFG